jgi:hypothetical protein
MTRRTSNSVAEKWLEAARALAPGDASVARVVRLAIEDPDQYMKTHVRDLRDRGVTKPIPTLPLIALLDALDDAKLVALIDCKSATDDVVFLMRGVTAKKKRLSWAWMKPYDEDDLDDLSMDRLLEAVASEANTHGLALVNIDAGSDQYAITIVERARTAKILKAMKAVGHPAKIIVARPLAKPKPAPTRFRLGTPMTEWPSGSADPSDTSRYFFHRERRRSLWTRRFETVFRVMEGPAWSYSMKQDVREHKTSAECTRKYVAFIAQLHGDGWLQFTLPEANKELCAHDAARKKGNKKS